MATSSKRHGVTRDQRSEISKAASFAMFGKMFLYFCNADHPWIVDLG